MLQAIHELVHSPERDQVGETVSLVDVLIQQTVASVLFDDLVVDHFEQSLIKDKVWHCFVSSSRLFGSSKTLSFNVWQFMRKCADSSVDQLDKERVLLKRCLHANLSTNASCSHQVQTQGPGQQAATSPKPTACSASNRIATEMYALLKLFLFEKQLQAQSHAQESVATDSKAFDKLTQDQKKVDVTSEAKRPAEPLDPTSSVSVRVVHVQLLLYAKHFESAHQRRLLYEDDVQLIKHTLKWFLKVSWSAPASALLLFSLAPVHSPR